VLLSQSRQLEGLLVAEAEEADLGFTTRPGYTLVVQVTAAGQGAQRGSRVEGGALMGGAARVSRARRQTKGGQLSALRRRTSSATPTASAPLPFSPATAATHRQ
jgi:hypothetical protein